MFWNGGQKNKTPQPPPPPKKSFRKNSHVTKTWKTTFQTEFFNKIRLKIGEHEYIYIFENKFQLKVILFKNGAKTSFLILGDNATFC